MDSKKLIELMATMPELRHSYDGYTGEGDFDVTKSEVIQWLARQPLVLEYAMQQLQIKKCLVYDETTGRWKGAVGNFRNSPFTAEQMAQVLGPEHMTMTEWLSMANATFDWSCGQFTFRKTIAQMVIAGTVLKENGQYRMAATAKKPGAPRSHGGLALALEDVLESMGVPYGRLLNLREWMSLVKQRTGARWSKASFYSKIQRLIASGHVNRTKTGSYMRIDPKPKTPDETPAG